MKYKIYLIFIGILLLSSNASAQEEITNQQAPKNDISINITALLGNVLSITDDDSGVPYAISYRRIYSKWAIRLSGAIGATNISENQQGVFTTLNKKESELRIGFERIHSLSRVFDMTFGIDFTGTYNTEESSVDTFNGFFSQEEKTWLVGGGPALRFMYKINNRVSFHTESTLYFRIGQINLKNNPSSVPDRTQDTYMLDLAMPQSLFITIAF